jgi:hypothetical protein
MFDLQADLNPLFNWNAKQLFVFLVAEYETTDNKLNQVKGYLIAMQIYLCFINFFITLHFAGCFMGQNYSTWRKCQS